MRCYDGCPDSELQALIDARERLRRQLELRRARPTYFPAEGRWQVFTDDHRMVGAFSQSYEAACRSALEVLT